MTLVVIDVFTKHLPFQLLPDYWKFCWHVHIHQKKGGHSTGRVGLTGTVGPTTSAYRSTVRLSDKEGRRRLNWFRGHVGGHGLLLEYTEWYGGPFSGPPFSLSFITLRREQGIFSGQETFLWGSDDLRVGYDGRWVDGNQLLEFFGGR